MDKDKKKTKTSEKRAYLCELTAQAREYRNKSINEAKTTDEAFYWESCTINYILLHYIYDVDGATEFKSFGQWKKDGYTINKGAKAFVLWGQPVKARNKEEEGKEKEAEPEQGNENFFPLCYLFSDKQVYKRQAPEEESPEQKPPEPQKGIVIDDMM